VGKTISSSQVFDLGFSLKSLFRKYSLFFLHFVGNESYIVLVKNGKSHTKKVIGSRLRESLTTWPKSRVTRKNQPINDSSDFSMCFSRGLFHGSSVASPVTKTTSSQILHQILTHNPYIKSHKNIGKWLNKITIKFDMELKPTKYIVVNHNFTKNCSNYILGIQ